ncbi:MAG: hypothetical protein ACHQHO_00610 [Solirubrobacterales bacterium]
MWALIIAVAAFLVSAIAAWASLRQLHEARTSNAFPATVDLFREYRSREMVAARRLLSQRLPALDPANGISNLPDDVAQAVLRVSHYLDNLGVQVAQHLIAPELVAGFLGDSTLRLWSQLEPFIVSERRRRHPQAYLQYFEHLAETLRTLNPAEMRTHLSKWEGEGAAPSA